jgi:hypothetical protein
MWTTTMPLPQDSRRIGWQVSWGHASQSCPLQSDRFEVVLELRSGGDLPWTQADPDPTLAALQIQEQRAYEIRIPPRPSHDTVLFFGDQPLADRSIGNTMVAEITPGNYVGPSRLLLQDGPHSLMDLPLEVRSRKLKYREHYRQLLDALLEWSAELAYRRTLRNQTTIETEEPSTS